MSSYFRGEHRERFRGNETKSGKRKYSKRKRNNKASSRRLSNWNISVLVIGLMVAFSSQTM